MANLYLPSGFIDFDRAVQLSSTLNIMIGPRNAGKTFSALLHYTGVGVPFVFMRTLKSQIELVFSNELSPFNKLNDYSGSRFYAEKLKGMNGLIGVYDDFKLTNGKKSPSGKIAGYCLSLAQVGATRGFNLDKTEVVIYDEFVKHQGEVVRFSDKQFTMYADIIFTLNRAREIEGRSPIKQWLLGNSDDMANNILVELSLVNIYMDMRSKGENYRKLPDRDISLFLMDDSPVAAHLRETSGLSKVFSGTSYLDMAYSNSFINDDYSDCSPISISGYDPLFVFDDIAVYRHKQKDSYYVRSVRKDAVFSGITRYASDERGRINVRQDNAGLYFAWLAGVFHFDSYNTKLKFLSIYKT